MYQSVRQQGNDMGLFDSIVNQATSAVSGQSSGSSAGPIEAVTGLLGNAQNGGLQGLIATFQKQGLGDIITSWIGNGENLPISGEQVLAVFGSGQIQDIAQKLGLSLGDASGAVAGMLPQVVDKLSPGGQLPDGDMLAQGVSMLGRLGL